MRLASLVFLLCLSSIAAFAQPRISFPGTYNYLLNKPYNGAFALTPDKRIAVTMSFVTSPNSGGQLTSFDPVTGQTLDSKFVGFGPLQVSVIAVADSYRVVTMISRGGPRAMPIYDMDRNGILTLRVVGELETTGDQDTDMLLSESSRAAFIWVHTNAGDQLKAVDLDTGLIFDQIITSGSPLLAMYDSPKRRIVAMERTAQVLFFDVTDPTNLILLGPTQLPVAGSPSGLKLAFSTDGNYLFVGSQDLFVIDTSTRQVVASLPGRFAAKMKLTDQGGTKTLALWPGATNDISLVNVTNPLQPTLINSLPIEQSPTFHDLAFSADGKRLFVSQANVITALSVPTLNTLWKNNLATQFGFKLETFGKLERLIGAWGSTSNSGATIYVVPNRTNRRVNFDGDAKSDIGLFRASTASWYWLNSQNGSFGTKQFGQPEDVPVPADFDGDGRTDQCVYRRNEGVWYVIESSSNTMRSVQFGISSDQPLPGDFDGDGKADLAFFRPRVNQWFALRSSDGTLVSQKLPGGGGVPIARDFDGDGKDDFGAFYTNGAWQIVNSGTGILSNLQFGTAGDIPVALDWDGDGRSDLAVYRPGSGTWYIQRSWLGFRAIQFGLSTDIPVPADYAGTGEIQAAVFRPLTGAWYILDGGFVNSFQFGTNGDRPLAAQ